MSLAPKLLNVEGVSLYVGIGESTVWAKVAAGTFPAPLKLGPRARAWVVTELDAWVSERIAERDTEAAATLIA